MPLDEQVRQAMVRWPDVPAVHGWLRLDRRGRWLLVDRGRPDFDEAVHGDGSEITSPPIVDFIGRNYGPDPQGRWHWQNGPQRVFVDLLLAPLLYRVLGEAPTQTLVTHTGWPAERIDRVAIDADGNLWIVTEHGPGCIDDRDLGALDLELAEDEGAAGATGSEARDPTAPASGVASGVAAAAEAAGTNTGAAPAASAPLTAPAAPARPAGRLRLRGDHAVQTLDAPPPQAFGFEPRPR